MVVEIDDGEGSNVEEKDEQHDPVGISVGVPGAQVCLQAGGASYRDQRFRQPLALHVHREKDQG